MAPWASLGGPGGSFSLLGRPWDVLWGSSGDLRASQEGPWGVLGGPWGRPGGSLGAPGGPREAPRGPWGLPRLSSGRFWRALGGPQGAPECLQASQAALEIIEKTLVFVVFLAIGPIRGSTGDASASLSRSWASPGGSWALREGTRGLCGCP